MTCINRKNCMTYIKHKNCVTYNNPKNCMSYNHVLTLQCRRTALDLSNCLMYTEGGQQSRRYGRFVRNALTAMDRHNWHLHNESGQQWISQTVSSSQWRWTAMYLPNCLISTVKVDSSRSPRLSHFHNEGGQEYHWLGRLIMLMHCVTRTCRNKDTIWPGRLKMLTH